jgi:hypothetical protein
MKKFAVFGGALVVGIVVAIVLVGSNLGGIVKKGVEPTRSNLSP